MIQASTHVVAEDRRERKLLLHRSEIDKLVGKVERDGYDRAHRDVLEQEQDQLEIALAKGKQTHDKRDAARTATGRSRSSVMRRGNRDA